MARFVVQLKESASRRFDAAMRSLLLVREKLTNLGQVSRPDARVKKIIRLPARVAS